MTTRTTGKRLRFIANMVAFHTALLLLGVIGTLCTHDWHWVILPSAAFGGLMASLGTFYGEVRNTEVADELEKERNRESQAQVRAR